MLHESMVICLYHKNWIMWVMLDEYQKKYHKTLLLLIFQTYSRVYHHIYMVNDQINYQYKYITIYYNNFSLIRERNIVFKYYIDPFITTLLNSITTSLWQHRGKGFHATTFTQVVPVSLQFPVPQSP